MTLRPGTAHRESIRTLHACLPWRSDRAPSAASGTQAFAAASLRVSPRLLAALLLAIAAPSFADDLVVAGPHQAPNPPPSVVGGGRFQFVYGSALFPGPVRISALAFSPTVDVATLGGTFAIHLGVTTRAVDGLTGDLDANATGPLTEVFDRVVALTDVFGANDFFALAFPFDRSFDYDPADGNLLVDIVTVGVAFSNTVVVSARTASDDLGSRAIDHPDVGTGADTGSPRIRFTVPEPLAAPIAAFATLLVLAHRRQGRRTPRCTHAGF